MTTTTIYIDRNEEELEIEVTAAFHVCTDDTLEIKWLEAFNNGKELELTEEEQKKAEKAVMDAAMKNEEREPEYQD